MKHILAALALLLFVSVANLVSAGETVNLPFPKLTGLTNWVTMNKVIVKKSSVGLVPLTMTASSENGTVYLHVLGQSPGGSHTLYATLDFVKWFVAYKGDALKICLAGWPTDSEKFFFRAVR